MPKTAIRCVSHTRRRALSVIGRRVRQAMDCSERRSPNFTPPCQAHNKLSEDGSARTCTLFNVCGYVKRAPVFWTAEREMWGHGLRFDVGHGGVVLLMTLVCACIHLSYNPISSAPILPAVIAHMTSVLLRSTPPLVALDRWCLFRTSALHCDLVHVRQSSR